MTPLPYLARAAAGVIAGVVTAPVDRLLDHFITHEQKRREHMVRKAPAHQLAGPSFAARIIGRRLTEREEKKAKLAFSIVYGVGWGLIYGAMRKRFPRSAAWGGLPFAIPFFFVCDGLMAPLLGLSPRLSRIPWQPSAKEMANHAVWTAANEMLHRALSGRQAAGRGI